MGENLINEVRELTDPELLAQDLLSDFEERVKSEGTLTLSKQDKEQVQAILEFLAELTVARMKGENVERAERWTRLALLNSSFGIEARAYKIKRAMHEAFEAKIEKIADGVKTLGKGVLETTIKAAIDGINPLS